MELYLSFSEIVRFFKRHLWKFAVLVAVCGILFGVLTLRSFKRQYTATSTILIACTIDDNASPDYSNQYASMLNVRLQAAIALADLEDVRAAVAEYAGVDDSSLVDLTAKQVGTSTLIELTVTTTDRANAATLADAAAEVIGEEISAIYPTPPIQVHLTSHAEEPAELSARSSAVKGGILGLVFGVILAVCIGLAILLLDHTIRSASYVEKSLKLPCLGSLAAKAEETGRADEFRRMRAAFSHQVGEKGTVLLTPVGGKRGAALAACGLARALAAARHSVLLVEADFSSSAQAAEALGVPKAGKGLVSVHAGGGVVRVVERRDLGVVALEHYRRSMIQQLPGIVPAQPGAGNSYRVQDDRDAQLPGRPGGTPHGLHPHVGEVAQIEQQGRRRGGDLLHLPGMLRHNGAGAQGQHGVGALVDGDGIGDGMDQGGLCPQSAEHRGERFTHGVSPAFRTDGGGNRSVRLPGKGRSRPRLSSSTEDPPFGTPCR